MLEEQKVSHANPKKGYTIDFSPEFHLFIRNLIF